MRTDTAKEEGGKEEREGKGGRREGGKSKAQSKQRDVTQSENTFYSKLCVNFRKI